MATEKRLIDANDALERLKKAEKEMMVVSMLGCKAVPMDGVIEFIETRPTVDALEVPCKIGDFVWAIRNFKGKKHPQRGIVSEMYFLKDMSLQIVVKYVARGKWGETVFATDKEAYAAIGERKDNDKN